MKIKWFIHEGVAADGKVDGGGSVCVDGDVRQGPPQWLSKIYPRTDDGVVAGFIAHFDSREEFESMSLELIEQTAMRLRTAFFSFGDPWKNAWLNKLAAAGHKCRMPRGFFKGRKPVFVGAK